MVRLAVLILVIAVSGCSMTTQTAQHEKVKTMNHPTPWKGIHFRTPRHEDVPAFAKMIDEHLAPLGINAIVFEVNYSFEFQSHPELRDDGAITLADARLISETCRKNDIRLIPMLNCLGHQSWMPPPGILLRQYPQFDETPDIPADYEGKDFYCRSWCPLHPDVNPTIFALIDELIDAFDADSFHVGMDEVFLIAEDQCPRCHGKDPAVLFARAVNDYYDHIARKRGCQMMIWGDRLLDASQMPYGKWEAAANGTAPAIDNIPTDIIICDWHYEMHDTYPSIEVFADKGFKIWPASWHNSEPALAFLDAAYADAPQNTVGYMGTTWTYAGEIIDVFNGKPEKASAEARRSVDSLKACLTRLSELTD